MLSSLLTWNAIKTLDSPLQFSSQLCSKEGKDRTWNRRQENENSPPQNEAATTPEYVSKQTLLLTKHIALLPCAIPAIQICCLRLYHHPFIQWSQTIHTTAAIELPSPRSASLAIEFHLSSLPLKYTEA